MLGALSVVMFWAFGVGVVLGVAALITAMIVVVDHRSGVTSGPAAIQEATIGACTGITGIVAGCYFLFTI